MKTIWMIKGETELGIEWFYAGAGTRDEALLMAAEAGFEGDQIEVKMIPNRYGVQAGEFRPINIG